MSKVLVLVLRGLPLAHVGCYGNDWVETPTLDRLAAEGVVFDQHFADRPDPAGAARSWRTGRYDLPSLAVTTPQPAESPDLMALLSDAGVQTVLIGDESRPFPEEFAAGWGEVRRVSASGDEGTPLERSLDAAVECLERLAGRDRWLVWLSLSTLLPPWDLPESFRTRYFVPVLSDDPEAEPDEEQDPLDPLPDPPSGPIDPEDDKLFLRMRYSSAGAVAYLDAGLALLVDHLREQNLLDGLTLIVTSDHGLPLGEHAVVGNVRPWPHEELVHLPLIVRMPGQARAGRRVRALTQSVDLMPTVLGLFGLPAPPVHGHDLRSLLRGEAAHVRPYAVTGHQVGDRIEWAVRTHEWAYLWPLQDVVGGDPGRQPQLFVKPDDRWEVNDVRQHHLELAEHVETVAQAFAEAARTAGPLEYPELRDVEAEFEAGEDGSELLE
jgi:arylsulfatase A-like enzyme